MKLADLYTLLQNSILTSEPLINPYLHAPPKGSVADRVAIYANGFYGRLEEALMSDYITLASVMGEDKFSNLCRNYIDAYPSCNDSLNFFGQNLSQFLIETVPYNKKPYLAEIAAFEWAEYQSMVAHDTDLLLASDLHSLPVSEWPEIKFYLHPSCKILTLNWNSLSLIKASRGNNSLPKPKKLKAPQHVLVWRRQLEVRYRKLERLELIMLSAIKRQVSFMELCELLSHEMPEDEVASYIVKELSAWLQEQLFSSR
jgi:hypothetical protein